ncbi:hypothetical protein [Hyunsoonleella pacifica]|uniref:DUF3828 domain-containing protein n=1 Tax=Hyunsoonleella pacifica TaxID=1080224 RepID=A0A4Q9FT37_9FLAO|nr:hypothetical protein [Hyunsoonleella pacifica]TBN17462.1 hypothetical protein EYD46_03860 [Hyunsoonleella pacifica]GGD11774.1 hypothetical protein GCM10011368_12210 [Hyunsoonleella pacifica]
MKLGVLTLLFFVFACASPTKNESYEKQFETYYKKNMYNPDSFKLVGATKKEGSIYHKANKEFLKVLTAKAYSKQKNDSLISQRLENQNQVFFKIMANNAVGVPVQNIISCYFIDGKLKYVDEKKID